jgi:hypothetical protein
MEKKTIVIGEITKKTGHRMTENKPNPKSRYEQGYFNCSKKYIGKHQPIFRSSLERRFMKWLDLSPQVLQWESEPFAIGYAKPCGNGGFKQGNYYIDFVFKMNNKTYVTEVKPHSQTMKGSRDFEINKLKWNATIEFCKKNGFVFLIVTEKFEPFKNIK